MTLENQGRGSEAHQRKPHQRGVVAFVASLLLGIHTEFHYRLWTAAQGPSCPMPIRQTRKLEPEAEQREESQG